MMNRNIKRWWTMLKLYAKSDLATRWGVTRQVVNNWSNRHSDFPPEIMRVDNGRMPLFAEEDVIKYEKQRKLGVQ
jgi:hypothetical protein